MANRTGSGRSSDMAIDDIVLQGESSRTFHLSFESVRKSEIILVPLITRTTRPTPSTTPRTRFNASCDFDVDNELCGWKSDTKYGWKVIHEREPNIMIGPSSDYSSIGKLHFDVNYDTITIFIS